MNREDIIRMAREAGFDVYEALEEIDGGFDAAERFAALVAAAERERIKAANAPVIEDINRHLSEVTAAIRARSNT